MRFGKGITILLCGALLAGSLGGCGKDKETKETGQEPVKGRYVETEEALPGLTEGREIGQVFMEEGKLHLLAWGQESGQASFQEWAQEGEGFTEVTEPWLASLSLPIEGTWWEAQLLVPGEGKKCFYAAYVAEGEEDYKAHLWTDEGGEAKEITPGKWREENAEWGGYEMLTGIAALDNGTLAAFSYTSADLLDAGDGSVLDSRPLQAQYDNILSDGENLWLYSTYSEGASGLTIEKRRNGKEDDTAVISFPQGDGQMRFCPGKDGTLFLAGEEGIFRGEEDPTAEGGARWELLLSGAETDFTLSDRWCTGMAVGEEGMLYALFRKSEGGSVLKKYVYDPEAVIAITDELKLYSVYESNLLTQAAALYHRLHPEVLITVEYAYPKYYDGETDYNEVYQKLNTMLMGEEAPDILVMDHLDIESYAGKGLLADLGDVIDPMEQSGKLLSNITSAFREEGKRYVIPLEFAFPIAVGRDITAADMGSMEALADFLSGQDVSYMGPVTTGELVERFYPYFCGDIVDGKQLDAEALGGYLQALKAIADNCGILDTRDKEERAYNMWELASEAKLAIEKAEGFNDIMFPLSVMDYIQGEFAAFGNCFIPMVQTGICAKTSHLDTAKDFLGYLLSEEVQQTDAYGGFPVNMAALEQAAHRDRSDAEAETEIMAEGGSVEFRIKDYSPETADKLVAICKGLEKPAVEDEKIREVLTEVLTGYFKGSQSLEETVGKVEDGLKMYLAE